jgi:TolA-binding protein
MLRSLLFICFMFSCSSPYFNTFYNAERFFEAGESKFNTNASSWEEIENYTNPELTKAIEKCAKLLTDFGDNEKENSYADDAYLMMIKSSYYLKNFSEVIQLNDLMLIKVPNSPLLAEAQIFAGNAYLKLGDTQQARNSYQNIKNVAKNFNLIAKSQIGIATIYLNEGEYDKAVNVLISALEFENKSEDIPLFLDEEIRYQLLTMLIRTLKERADYKKIIDHSKDWVKLKNSDYKEVLVLSILNAHLELQEPNVFVNFFSKIKNDGDFTINTQLQSIFDLYNMYIERNFDFYDLEYEKLYKEPGFRYKKELSLVHIKRLEGTPEFRDSLLKTYNIHLSQIKGNDERLTVIQKIEKLSFFLKADKLRMDSDQKIEEIKSKLDTLDKNDPDYKKLEKDIMIQKELKYSADFDLAEHYFNDKNYDLAYKYFNNFINNSTDSSKLAVSHLYLANIFEINSDEEKAKKNYRYVLENFPEFQNNIELYKKLGLSVKANPNQEIYANFLNKYDYENLSWDQFYNEYKVVVNRIDTASEFHEKLKFVSIMLSIKHNKNHTYTIGEIEAFRKSYPSSIYLQEINKYPTKAFTDTDQINKNSDDKDEDKTNIRLLTPLKASYLAEDNALVEVELTIGGDGSVKSFEIKKKEQIEYKFSVAIIVNDLKFNKAEEEERKYLIKFNFTDGEVLNNPKEDKPEVHEPDEKNLEDKGTKKEKRKVLEIDE